MHGLSLVVPLYNEADNIRELIGTLSAVLEKEKIEYELVLVDNGSSDATGALIEEYARADNRIRRVNVCKNIGYGWGIIKGLEAAEGEHLGFMCGDGQIKPADVVRVYRKLTEERLDLCKVRRVYREDGLQRKVISFFYNAIFGILFKAHTDDINGTPKIFTRRIYEAFKPVSKDWFIDAEIILKCAQLRANVGSVPVTFYRRKCGSTNVGMATIMEFLKNITLYYFMPEKFRREHGDVTKRL